MLKVRLPQQPLERANTVKNLFERINFQSKINTCLFIVAVAMLIPFGFMGLLLQTVVAGAFLTLVFVAFFIDPVEPTEEEGRKVKKHATAIRKLLTQNSVVLSLAVVVAVFNTASVVGGVSFYTITPALLAGVATMFVIATAPEKART